MGVRCGEVTRHVRWYSSAVEGLGARWRGVTACGNAWRVAGYCPVRLPNDPAAGTGADRIRYGTVHVRVAPAPAPGLTVPVAVLPVTIGPVIAASENASTRGHD